MQTKMPRYLFLLVFVVLVGQGCSNDTPVHLKIDLTMSWYSPTSVEMSIGIPEVIINTSQKERAVRILFSELSDLYRSLNTEKIIQLKSLDQFSDGGAKYIRAAFLTQNLTPLFAAPIDRGFMSLTYGKGLAFHLRVPYKLEKRTRDVTPLSQALRAIMSKLSAETGIRVKATFPWKVVEANGKISEDGNVVTWTFSLSEAPVFLASFEDTWLNSAKLKMSHLHDRYLGTELNTYLVMPKDCPVLKIPEVDALSENHAASEIRDHLRKVYSHWAEEMRRENSLAAILPKIGESFWKAHEEIKGTDVLDPMRTALFWLYIRVLDPLLEEDGVFAECMRQERLLTQAGKSRLGEAWVKKTVGEIQKEMTPKKGK